MKDKEKDRSYNSLECIMDKEKENSHGKCQDCFTDASLKESNHNSPSRGDDDHRIKVILGSLPPNKPAYYLGVAHREEIMTQ